MEIVSLAILLAGTIGADFVLNSQLKLSRRLPNQFSEGPCTRQQPDASHSGQQQ